MQMLRANNLMPRDNPPAEKSATHHSDMAKGHTSEHTSATGAAAKLIIVLKVLQQQV